MIKRFLSKLILIIFICIPIAGYASEKNQLLSLNHHIELIQKDLKKANLKKSHLQQSLQQTEFAEGRLAKALHKTQTALTQQRHLLAKLSYQAKQLSDKIQKNKANLKKQIQTAFLISRQPFIKYLLDANSIEQYQRTFVYFHYLTSAQTDIIKQLQKTETDFQNNQNERHKALVKLINIQKTELQNSQILKKTQSTRHHLIKKINQHIFTKKEKLSHLIQDRKRLEKTLQALQQKALKNSLFKQHFSTLRRLLPWPTKGVIHQYFGTQIGQSELRWSGVLIDAPSGTAVRSVAPGKVIFSKWLQGYGFLIIINHGNGYMTLYGRNQSLLKKSGDWVAAHAKIATVGESGGFNKTALYFSIRHNAKPLNPQKWCKKTT